MSASAVVLQRKHHPSLQRPLRILQGQGCIIQARPGARLNDEGYAEVGGFVVEDEIRVVG